MSNHQIPDISPLYEDNHLLCVIKPAGLLCQSDKSGDPDLLTICREYIKNKYNKKGNVYLGLIHRLDRCVSGVVILARTSKAAARISEQFRKREVSKIYHAAVMGKMNPLSGERCDFIKKDTRLRIAIEAEKDDPDGREASLIYHTLTAITISQKNFNQLLFSDCSEANTGKSNSDTKHQISLLEIQLLTGRFHQIRFQLKMMGSPVLGDLKYHSEFFLQDRLLALEAIRLSFNHPTTGERLSLVGHRHLQAVFHSY